MSVSPIFRHPNRLTALLFVAWMLPGLLGHDPWKPDEAYSFGLVYSAIRDPGIVPMLAGEPFVEKPPLFYFTAAALARALSPPLALHDAARLATAFYLGVAALFVFLTARLVFNAAAGRIAVVLLLGSIGLLIRGHQLITDAALIAGFAIGLYGFARAAQRPLVGGLWLGTGTGMGFLAKGLLAPGVLGIIALILPIVARSWRQRAYAGCLAIALLATAPWLLAWPLALWHVSPTLFHEWFWDNNFGRFLGTSHLGPRAEHGHYLKILPWYTLPLLPLAAWTLWCARDRISDGVRLLLAFVVTTVAVLSISADARELYALPLLLPLSVIAAPGVFDLSLRASRTWYFASVGVFGATIALAWCAWIALEFGVPASAQGLLLNAAPAYEPGLRWFPVLVAAAYTVAWVIVVRTANEAGTRAAIAWTAGLTVSWALAMTLFVGWLDSSKSYRAMSVSLKAALPASYKCISSRGLGEPQRAVLDYFANIVTYREESGRRRQDCELLLVQHSVGDSVSQTDIVWTGARAGDAKERFVLYRVKR